jgi:hypothetical protein
MREPFGAAVHGAVHVNEPAVWVAFAAARLVDVHGRPRFSGRRVGVKRLNPPRAFQQPCDQDVVFGVAAPAGVVQNSVTSASPWVRERQRERC